MKVTENTKISTLIKENSEVIEAIVSINKHFTKLRNPILRKVLAARVTIKDAARIGGTDVQIFFDKLSALGFFCEMNNKISEEEKLLIPEFYKNLLIKNTQELDVIDDLAKGNDPFTKIMDVLAKMPDENTLKLINTFEPTPLLKILTKKGYSYYTVVKEPSVIFTYIKHTGAEIIKSQEIINAPLENDDEIKKIISSYGEKIKTIDVRDLEMPLPMVTILNELEVLAPDTLLYVHHKKVPQHLLPEVEALGFKFQLQQIAEGNVKLLIYK